MQTTFTADSPDPRQLPLGSGTRPGIRPVTPGRPAKAPATAMFRVPVAFRPTGVRLLDHPVPARNSASLTVGPPGTQRCRDLDGVSTFRTNEMRPGWVPSLSRGGGVHPDGHCFHLAPAASQRPALHPAETFHLAGLAITGHRRVHLRSPVRSSPCLWPPDGAAALGLLP